MDGRVDDFVDREERSRSVAQLEIEKFASITAAPSADIFGRSHTERNAVEDPILSFPDPNHVGNAHLHINRHPEMR